MDVTDATHPHLLRVCLGSSCFARGNRDLVGLAESWQAEGPDRQIELVGSLCAGRCLRGPVVELDGVVHERVDAVGLRRLLDALPTGAGR